MKKLLKLFCMIFCNEGSDENPRSPKILDVAIQYFKKYNLDGLLISTNALGLSAYNQVERRMAPFSKSMSTILLPLKRLGHIRFVNKNYRRKPRNT